MTDRTIQVEMASALGEVVSAKVAVSGALAEHVVDGHYYGVGYGDDSAPLSTAWSDPAVLRSGSGNLNRGISGIAA